ncbi:MAG: hypothetical protein CMJ18_00510 [Phycisphaeraceae bacterium]|nr:hypothetical protein [Phycisphaeraceae bacterium]
MSLRIRLGMAVLVAALPVVIIAAPLLPTRSVIPDEVRSLARIDEVGLEVWRLPRSLRGAGVDERRIRSILERGLNDAGIRVTQDHTTPRIVVKFWPATDSKLPDVIAIVLTLDIHQRIAMMRLDQEQMTLPTTSVIARAITTKDKRGGVLMKKVGDATDLLVNALTEATNRVEAGQ